MAKAFDILENPPENHNVDQAWFDAISQLLLNETTFMIGDQPHRICEVEYYYNGDEHPDPFAHGDEVQLTHRRWYFHRDEGQYRGGSFKGLDVSFGREGAYGGVLIRTIEKPDGEVVNGCSLCVDHMLGVTGFAKVAALDGDIGTRLVDDATSPLHLVHSPNLEPRDIDRTARVGLTLKRARQFKTMPQYIMKPYRALTRPRDIKKGRIHHVIALHKQGMATEDIHQRSKSPRKTIGRYIENYNVGLEREDFKGYIGRSLKTADLCSLHGTWQAHYGTT